MKRIRSLRRFCVFFMSFALAMTMAPVSGMTAVAAEPDTDAESDQEISTLEAKTVRIDLANLGSPDGSDGWIISGNALKVQNPANSYTLTGSTLTHRVEVDSVAGGGTFNITLEGAEINLWGKSSLALDIGVGCTLNLTLSGYSILSGSYGYPALHAPEGTELTIDGNGSLQAYGGTDAAGIGGGDGENGGVVTVNNGVVTGLSDANGAGIGGGQGGNGGTITINGGEVIGVGNWGRGTGLNGAGIGGGKDGSGGTITINGGSVEAIGGGGAAGIGGGYGGDGGTVKITGGKVTAEGGSSSTLQNCSGIGSGSGGNKGTFKLEAGTVEADGGAYGYGIGSHATVEGGTLEAK